MRLLNINRSVSRIIWITLSASLFVTGNAQAVQLYSNGGLSTGPTALSGSVAPAGTNWSEVQNETGITTASNTNSGYAIQQGSFRLADDFTVPAGETWTVTHFEMFSYKTGAAANPTPFAAYSMQLWDGSPNNVASTVLAGDTTTNLLTSSVDASLYRIFN
jgi:hypothetical protein